MQLNRGGCLAVNCQLVGAERRNHVVAAAANTLEPVCDLLVVFICLLVVRLVNRIEIGFFCPLRVFVHTVIISPKLFITAAVGNEEAFNLWVAHVFLRLITHDVVGQGIGGNTVIKQKVIVLLVERVGGFAAGLT